MLAVTAAGHKLGTQFSRWDTRSELNWQPEKLHMESLEFLQLPLFQERIFPEGGDAKSAGGLWWGRDGEATQIPGVARNG